MSTVARFNGNEFIVIAETGSFEDAIQACSSIESQLASFSSVEELNFILDLLDAEDNTLAGYWVGITRSQDSVGADPSSFTFLDGSDNTIIALREVGEFPWADDQPNDNNGGQFCVRVDTDPQEQGISDRNCDRQDTGALCKVEAKAEVLGVLTIVAITFSVLTVLMVIVLVFEVRKNKSLKKRKQILEIQLAGEEEEDDIEQKL